MAHGNGKIANLPAEIREELNYRINDGEQGSDLVEWLNSLPEVVEILKDRFDGVPISEQNLSEHRKRGYRQWLVIGATLDEASALSGNAERLAETGINCEKLLLTLTGIYASMIQCWNITPMDELNYKMGVFRGLTNAVLTLRRAEILKARLEIERERLEILRERHCGKSRSSASAPASSSSESRSNSRIPQPTDVASSSGENQATPQPDQGGEPNRRGNPPCEPPATQPPLPVASSPATKPSEIPAQPAAIPLAPSNPPPRPTPAYRDPRSRYSLA
jgi:hypothetical protein